MTSSLSAARRAQALPAPIPPSRHAPIPGPGLHLAHPLPARRAHRSPLALWHLLSLDAPTVAALWTLFIAFTCGLHLPSTTPLAMALAVWMLYAADRLLDARTLGSAAHRPLAKPRTTATPSLTPSGLEARHLFHHRHRRPFLAGVALASVALAILLPRLNPDAIRIDLLLGGLLLGYFLLIHTTGNPHRLPKEFAVGIFFSAAVFVPTVARQPHLRLLLLPHALLFGALCTLNCLFIYAWEHDPHRAGATATNPHLTTRLALRYLRPLALLLVLSSLIAAPLTQNRALPLAILLSSTLLLALDRSRSRFSALHLRAAADLALLTPLLFLPFLHT